MFANVQAVLFDLDGTLVDSAPDLGAAANAVRTAHGLPPLPLSLYRPLSGTGAKGFLRVGFGIDDEHPDFAVLRDEFFANYQQCLTERTQVFPGVPELISELTELGLKWGVVTNKAERFTLPLTSAMPLFASAGTLISGDTTPYSKPHPHPLLEAARQLGVPPERCVYVGDDERDIMAGLAAGMGTVAVSYGYLGLKTDISLWGAHATIDSLNELLPLIA